MGRHCSRTSAVLTSLPSHSLSHPSPHRTLQDKAIGRFMVRNMVDAGGLNDLKEASAYECESLLQLSRKGCGLEQMATERVAS